MARDRRLLLALEASGGWYYEHNRDASWLKVTETCIEASGLEPIKPERLNGTETSWSERIHPEDRERLITAHGDLLAGRVDRFSEEIRLSDPDGGWCWLSAVSLSVEFGENGQPTLFAGVVRNITASKRAETKLLERDSRCRRIVQTMHEAVGEIDKQGNIVFLNDRTCEMFGLPREQLLGRQLTDFLDDKNRAILLNQGGFRHIVAGQAYEIEWTRLDGSHFWTLCSPVPLQDALGRYRGSFAVLTDITARKQAEEILRRALEEARIAGRAKQEFLATMSHELRTPLNAVIGFAEIIRDEAMGPVGNLQYRDYAVDICNAGTHLLELVNDLLDLAKIEAGGLELREGDIDVSTAVEAAVNLVRGLAETSGVHLEVNLPERLPAVRGDERKLKQILVNLLGNAVKFTKEGGSVTLDVEYMPDGDYEFRVRDTGIGMAAEDISIALSTFGQVGGELTTTGDSFSGPASNSLPGSGLGLPLAKALVEQHGGSFDLHSELGVGTEVTVRLPDERVIGA